ncbi:MAG TPA: hypothetical protein VIP05_15290 [Burkholderiaceae bacterium]
MDAFAQVRRASLLERIRAFIAQRAQRPVHDDELVALCLRGEHYGLVSEQEIAGYVVIAWAVEAGRERQDPPWIANIMNDPHRVGADRVAALYRAADKRAARP